MTVEQHLELFYKENGIPPQGGEDKKTFKFNVFGINFNLPNPEFRRAALHIHDIQHILLKKDTTWKGESYIAGWEISTGMWKHFLLGILGFWAMGYGMWLYPKEVYRGYLRGLQDRGVIDLGFTKSEFLEMDYEQLNSLVHCRPNRSETFVDKLKFLFWVLVSQFVLFFPILALAGILIYNPL